MRSTQIKRNTAETKIEITLNLDGTGMYENYSGCGFLDHMLDLFARHGRFDLFVKCDGDTTVDYHHTVEDIAITLGQVFADCLGDKCGITRYGSVILPMDEVLMMSAVDISGRGVLGYNVKIPTEKVGDFDTELTHEFMQSFAANVGMSLHFDMLAGENSHHIIEAMFKAMARALSTAVAIDEKYKDEIPSTKGVL
ncbi:MAG: imidazoleglycerol-phosphate dehydratase HisB [Oscillospiraceae bacterium]